MFGDIMEAFKIPEQEQQPQQPAPGLEAPSPLSSPLAPGGDTLIPPPRNPAAPADWAQNAVRGVAGKLGDIISMPRRAMEGGITSESAVPWAADTAMMMTASASPFSSRSALTAGAGSKMTQPPKISDRATEDALRAIEDALNMPPQATSKTPAPTTAPVRESVGQSAGELANQHLAALVNNMGTPRGLVEYARKAGLSDKDVKRLIDDNFSTKVSRERNYQEYLAAKGGR